MYKQIEYEKLKVKKKEYEEKLNKLKAKSGRVSLFRAITFILGFCFIAVGIADKVWLFSVIGVAFFIGFIFLVRYHSIIDVEMSIINSKYQVTKDFCLRFEDKWNEFADTGEEFIDEKNFVVTDVDILGPNSLYQKISLCNTFYGKRRLAKVLSQSLVDDRGLRQSAILELSKDLDFVVDFTSATKRVATDKIKANKIEEFIEYCNDEKAGILPGWTKIARFVLPLIEIALVIAWLTDVLNYGYPLGGLFALISFSMITRHITDGVVNPLYVMGVMLESYMYILKLVDEKKFENHKLKSIKDKLCGSRGAMVALNKLKVIIQAYNISYNPVVHQLLCGVFLWDHQLAASMEKWKRSYGSNISDCFELIGELEELLSLSVVGILHEHCYAEIKEEADILSFSAKNMYHPLIKQDKVVSNDASLKNGITIITGSNMSGKTTFLRTMAINLVLAYVGAPVCAESMSSSYMKIFTSMRVTDDVAHGISTFYAEILRIKNMSEYKKKELPMLCLIDEIFKGTNSADRIVGAKEVITQLSGKNSMVIVSTHDFELCSLTDKNNEVECHLR